jgi:hypothetical protein
MISEYGPETWERQFCEIMKDLYRRVSKWFIASAVVLNFGNNPKKLAIRNNE